MLAVNSAKPALRKIGLIFKVKLAQGVANSYRNIRLNCQFAL